MLFGRDDVCARLDTLLGSVRTGRGEALLLLGPPGIGKTALLDYAAQAADADLRVLRCRAVAAEAAIPYAALSQVLLPLVHLLPALAAPQRNAVTSALAIGPPTTEDRLALYAGTMHLLAAAASESGLVVLVDDVHSMDVASRDALFFAQRRLDQDPVLFLLSARPEPGLVLPTTLPVHELQGIDARAAGRLLELQDTHVSEAHLQFLVSATGGNPLALRDVPAFVPAVFFADYPLASRPVPVGPALTLAYGQAAQQLPAAARQAVLIAAMLDGAELPVVVRALRFAGLTVSALEQGEDAGLLRMSDGVLRMRHPLVRAAVHQAASASALRAAHLAAADGLAASGRPHGRDARIWHLAEAAVGIDETTAALLEELAIAAMARAGYAAAAITYQKAAQLSEPGPARLRRLLAAARTALTGGMGELCTSLLRQVQDEPTSAADEAAADHLRGQLETWSGDPSRGADRLQAGAERIRSTDPALSLHMAADATVAAILSGDMERAAGTARLAREVAAVIGPPAEPFADLILGAVQTLRGDGDVARTLLDRCRPAFDRQDLPVELLQQLVHLATAYSFIDAFRAAVPLFRRAIAMARRHGAASLLPFALTQAAVTDFRTGAWDDASAGAHEALRLAEDSGRATERANTMVVLAMVDAARGKEQARAQALAAAREARAMGTSVVEAQAYSMVGLLELGLGRPAAALEPLRRCGRLATTLGLLELGHLQWAAELVEACVRSGRTAEAEPTLALMRESCRPGATRLNRALLARCEGLSSSTVEWEGHFQVALEAHLGEDGRPFELARTELCFGERLRRERRRKDARAHLSAAWERFDQLGATAWARRASLELVATGTTVPRPTEHLLDVLTPQELQVARVVAEGRTNREVANSLFLSQKTVEFHLSGVYRRLGIRSRDELTELLRSREQDATV